MFSLGRRVKDIIFRLAGIQNRLSSDAYISYARSKGCTIGQGTQFFGEKKLDLNLAPMIEIGADCILTDRVRVLTHTWDKPVLDKRFDDSSSPQYEAVGSVTIGDNVFIGENSLILPNVEIGGNTIIGAGSVVTSDIPPESVAVGHPCRVVMGLEEYRKKRIQNEREQIAEYIASYRAEDIDPDPEAVRLLNQFDS